MAGPITLKTAMEVAKEAYELLDAATKARSRFGEWYQLKPTGPERAELVSLCAHLNERRVFYDPYEFELPAACIASLDEVRRRLLESSERITRNTPARAFVGAMLSHVRAFLDEWRAVSTPIPAHTFKGPLTSLRIELRKFVEELHRIEPSIDADRILAWGPDERGGPSFRRPRF